MSSELVRRDVQHPDGRVFSFYGDVPDATVEALAQAPTDTGYDVSKLHRRFDRLTGEWVLISPARNVRPSTTTSGAGAAECPLCPGGPELPGTFDLVAFENRFPSLAAAAPDPGQLPAGLAPGAVDLLGPSRGRCLVIVYTAEHVVGLADLPPGQLAKVVAVWRDQSAALWDGGAAYVMAFENHGSEVGATLPHLHGQLYAFDHVPPKTTTKRAAHHAHRQRHDTCLGCTLVDEDVASERVVFVNDHFVAAVPFAARWPYEVQLRARRHGVRRLADLDADAAAALVEAIQTVIATYDGLWDRQLPYMMCVQEAPPERGDGGAPLDDWHLHVELMPPNRNESRLKVRASVETALETFILDVRPEDTAAQLAAVRPTTSSAPANVPAVVIEGADR